MADLRHNELPYRDNVAAGGMFRKFRVLGI
jgi:hypothetical protein